MIEPAECESLETLDVVHFNTGETLARVSQANPGLLARDMRKAGAARDRLREIPCATLIAMMKKAADLYRDGTLPVGDGEQSPDDFARLQSASTGLPEHMCKANMAKNHFVLSNMDRILDALTRGLDLEILARGYGEEARGVTVLRTEVPMRKAYTSAALAGVLLRDLHDRDAAALWAAWPRLAREVIA